MLDLSYQERSTVHSEPIGFWKQYTPHLAVTLVHNK